MIRKLLIGLIALAWSPLALAQDISVPGGAGLATPVSAANGGTGVANSTTLTFPGGNDTAAGLATVQTFSAANIFSAAGAASTPAVKVTGTPFAGTGTTSFPLVYVQDAAATASTVLSTTGTALGVNAHTGVGNLVDFMLDGVSELKVSSAGTVTSGGTIVSGNGVTVAAAGALSWSGRGIMSSPVAGTVKLGNADAAAPVAQTLAVQNVVSGTSNTAGSNLTISGSVGTGTGAGGDIIVKTAKAGTTGTTQNTGATVFTFSNLGVPVRPSFTVSALPTCGAGIAGGMAWVTDANATTFLTTVAGGGANKVPVSCDGTNWVIG